MPWMETRVSDERMKFIVACDQRELSMAELCRTYGISRKTGYKWIERWQDEGPPGLVDHSRAPHTHPNKVTDEQIAAILKARDRWGWGARKLRVLLHREQTDVVWPVVSTIHQILVDHGLVVPRKKRRRVPRQTEPLAHCTDCNRVWCCDFKGHFCTGDGRICYPLTIMDGFSRYLLRCQGLTTTSHEAAIAIFKTAFREYGLPGAIRSDNGTPFASRAVGGLSRLSVWWTRLGIRAERIEPGKPQQNGRHERMHLTLKQQTANPPASTFRKQQERFDAFQEVYNEVRPHEALDMQTPASIYVRSARDYPDEVPEVRYPGGWLTRKVQARGEIYWKHEKVFISEVLYGEPVGLEPIDGRYWRVYYGAIWLGVFDAHSRSLLNNHQLGRCPHLKPESPLARPSAPLQGEPEEQ